ncbi:MAG: YqgE/AlgH family protein [Paracoccaceae bacterium]|nr:YqgE/AlgH family protein [Paracoccaceae bacterium]
MQSSAQTVDFTGQVLIAMPGMGDPRFERSVIYMVSHSDRGAMGLIVNKPNTKLLFIDLLEQMSIEIGAQTPKIPVHFGGPVEHGRGFVLHSRDYVSDLSTLEVDGEFGMTATQDILEDIARGEGPASAIMALGYAGWAPGQLEQEIGHNGWLTSVATPELIFAKSPEDQWQEALKLIGVDALALSGMAGRA